jgi:hypothetical protein
MSRPALQRLLEAICCAMHLDQGEQRVVLVYVDGRLVGWEHQSAREGPDALARFDAEPAVVRLADRFARVA